MRTASVARLRATLSPRSYELRSATLALLLLRQCVATWTVLVGVWTVDVIARCVLGYSPATDWAFVADCAVDVIAKTRRSMVKANPNPNPNPSPNPNPNPNPKLPPRRS